MKYDTSGLNNALEKVLLEMGVVSVHGLITSDCLEFVMLNFLLLLTSL